jgi:peptidoglycan/LPS O-acetylase OafA/YrhL
MRRLALLDYARFFAAMSVVTFHYLFNGIANGKISSIQHIQALVPFAKYGYLGVELFFMISGYVIFFSATRCSADKFAVGRVVRLYPTFFVAVLFTSLFAMLWGGEKMSVSLSQVLANLTMAPPLFGHGFVDGVYWTLIYEIKFYGLVFFLLFIGLSNRLGLFFKSWPFAMCAASLMGYSHLPFLGGYFCYFAAGALFAQLSEKREWVAAIGIGVCAFLSIKFSIGNLDTTPIAKEAHYSVAPVVLIISLFYVFFLVLNSSRGANLSLPFSKTLGAITYPLYLIHAHVGYMLISRFANENNKIPVYITTVLLILVVALAIHKLVETKLAWLWKGLFTNTVGSLVVATKSCLIRALQAITVKSA